MHRACLLLVLGLTSTGAAAQSAARAGITSAPPASPAASSSVQITQPQPRAPSRSAWAVASSFVLPGAGQAMLRQERFVPYVAAEAFFFIRYAQHARDARRERDRYRTLAANVARAPFGLARQHGTFDYYESMEHFVESGAFDATLGGDLDPEPDTTTFNGRMWLLARQTFWRDVTAPPPRDSREWKLAESFYLNRAVGPAFRWSWRDAQLEYDEFRRTIRRSNESYRDALADLSVLIANHVLSGVDALVSVRLRSRNGRQGRDLSIRGELPIR
ncbi:MAG: hypothetical protein ACT4P6_01300 [Gemmatimonadaceae bacterium]